MIRPFGPEDAPAVAELLHEDLVPQAVTAAGLLHWLRSQPARARAATWVALEEGELAGWARARLLWKTRVRHVGELWVFVRPELRARGHGRRLHDVAERHLSAARAHVFVTWATADEGHRFLGARDYRASRSERISVLDLEGFRPFPSEVPDGFRAVPLGDVVDRPRELHALDAAATSDVPETFVEDDLRYDEWLRETLEHPGLSHEGSVVVLHGQRPVAYAFLKVDPDAGLAANEMTGTLPPFRRCGLARLAKLGTIRWAREQGFRTIVTANDERNLAMLRLNESLGYRHVLTETQYLRGGLS